ncbi:MAG: chemotaxis protein CheX [Gemmatimonadales bacterium]
MSGFERSVVEIVQGVWECVLGLPLEEDDPFRLSLEAGQTYAGVVQITGAWDGAVALQCSDRIARKAAEIMLGVPADQASIGDIQDALGELANMTGGNFKALLPEPCHLSLPVVVEGKDFRMRLPGANQVLAVAFRSEDAPFGVTVLQRAPATV